MAGGEGVLCHNSKMAKWQMSIVNAVKIRLQAMVCTLGTEQTKSFLSLSVCV